MINFMKKYLMGHYIIMKKFTFHIIYAFCLIFFGSCETKKNHSQNTNFTLNEITIAEIHNGYNDGIYTVKEIVSQYIDRIKQIDQSGPEINSIIIINPDALSIADSLDQIQKQEKKKGSLFAIPVLLKDNIDTHDKMPTTAGSRVLKDSFPLKDSWVAKKLRESGAVILGKTNLSEWANYRASYSSSGWSGVGGQTKNPYVLDRNPCGSSSGSAVAVALGIVDIAIGTETNGSISCPSSVNGIVGIKPTVGLVSRSGIIPISNTQDTAGPMALTVKKAAKVLEIIAGYDSNDNTTKKIPDNMDLLFSKNLNKNSIEGKRFGLLSAGLDDSEGKKLHKKMKDIIEGLGGELIVFDDKRNYPSKEEFFVLKYEFREGIESYLSSAGF